MAGFELNEYIGYTPDEVFSLLIDPEQMVQAVDSLVSFKQTSGGSVQKGTTFRQARRINGRVGEANVVVTRFERPKVYEITTGLQGFTASYRYLLSPKGEGTQVRLVCEVKAGGLKAFMLPAVVAAIQREDGGQLKRFKEILGKR